MAAEWREIRVGDLVRSGALAVNDGYRVRNDELGDEGIPFVRGGDIGDGWINTNTEDRIRPEFADRVRGKLTQSEDVAFITKGTVGRAGRLRPEQPSVVFAPQVAYWRVLDRSVLDPLFIFYFLQTHAFQSALDGVKTHGSMVADYVSISQQHDFLFRFPDIATQRAIAYILGSLDDKIESNRRTNEALEAMAHALFRSWFVDFDPTRENASGAVARQSEQLSALFPARFVDSELGDIPDGWTVGKLGDVARHPRRTVRPDQIEPGTPYIALEHMPRQSIALTDWGAGDGLESNKFSFKRGEILFGKLRPYFHKVGVAPVDGVCSTDIVVVAPVSRLWFGFVIGTVSSVEFIDYTNAGSTGTKMPRTSWDDMARYRTVLPFESVAAGFTELLQPSIDRIISAAHESQTLAALRKALLSKLMSEELALADAERFVTKVT